MVILSLRKHDDTIACETTQGEEVLFKLSKKVSTNHLEAECFQSKQPPCQYDVVSLVFVGH